MARTGFDFPGDFPAVGDDKCITPVWGSWFTRAHNAIASMYQSGTTADRPTALLWVGRGYFDTSLGKKVYVKTAKPAPAVWVDGVGTVS